MRLPFEAVASVIVARPRVVVVVWLVLASLGVLLGQTLPGRLAAEGPFPRDSESAREARAVDAHIPEVRGIPMALVFTAHNPHSGRRWTPSEAARAHLRDERRVVGVALKLPGVAALQPAPAQTVRRRGTIEAIVTLAAFRLRMTNEEAQDHLGAMEDDFKKVAGPSLSIGLLGTPVISERYTELSHEDLVSAERLALPFACGLLLVAFLSVVAALLPMLLASVVVAVTLGCLTLLTHVISLTVFSTTAVTILALGLGIDYSLFMVTRVREEIVDGYSMEDAVRRSIDSTGRAIALSGTAIALSLLSLLAVGLPDFSSIALGGATVGLVAVAVALTLLPAIILLLGHRLERLTLRRKVKAGGSGLWPSLARLVVRRPLWIVAISGIGLLLLSVPATSLSPSVRLLGSLPPGDKVSREFEQVADSYGAGFVAPLEIASSNVKQVAHVLTKSKAFGTVVSYAENGKWTLVLAVLAQTPDTARAQTVVRRLRQKLGSGGSSNLVGGLPAAAIDLSQRIEGRSMAAVFVACVAVVAALMFGLRSVLIPIKAAVGSLLSVGAALGVLALLFPADASGSNIEPFIPLLLFTIIFGLSVDYEVFLLSRVREEVLAGADTRSAVSTALTRSARSISLAGLCLASVFVGLATASLRPLQQLGIGVAVGVLLDVTVVRCMLIPAAAVVLGRWNWWLPRPLGRVSIVKRNEAYGAKLHDWVEDDQ